MESGYLVNIADAGKLRACLLRRRAAGLASGRGKPNRGQRNARWRTQTQSNELLDLLQRAWVDGSKVNSGGYILGLVVGTVRNLDAMSIFLGLAQNGLETGDLGASNVFVLGNVLIPDRAGDIRAACVAPDRTCEWRAYRQGVPRARGLGAEFSEAPHMDMSLSMLLQAIWTGVREVAGADETLGSGGRVQGRAMPATCEMRVEGVLGSADDVAGWAEKIEDVRSSTEVGAADTVGEKFAADSHAGASS